MPDYDLTLEQVEKCLQRIRFADFRYQEEVAEMEDMIKSGNANKPETEYEERIQHEAFENLIKQGWRL